MSQPTRLLLLLLGVLAIAAALEAPDKRNVTVHTAFPTECGRYFVWQSMGMVYSHRKVKQPGPLTRIVSCTPKEWEEMSLESREFVTTHVAPNYATHPRTGDRYPAYNKPMAVIDWLAKTDVKEDYVLIIDADMIMRRQFIPDPSSALATSAFFGYMIGVNNELALKHVPEVTPRDDELAGPKGRRGDKAGGFTMMQTDQLRKVAPLWLQYTEDVRADPDAWKLSGDQYATKPGDKPWISEMYGYSFACAKANVWHKTPIGMMLYPGYDVRTPPHVLHYGLLWSVGDSYSFDKHWHYNFDPFLCPPWNLEDVQANEKGPHGIKGGLFPHPPSPSSFKTDELELLKDLLSVEPVITLNAALCERHLAKCSPSPELEQQCSRAKSLEAELDARMAALLPKLPEVCENVHLKCEEWAMSGECSKNPAYMMNVCVKACGFCTSTSDNPVVIEIDAHAIEKQQVAGRGAVASNHPGTDAGDLGAEEDVGDDDYDEAYEEDQIDAENDAAYDDRSKGIVSGDREHATSHVPDDVVQRLLDRCRQSARDWSAHQVAECVERAKDGIEYQQVGNAGGAKEAANTMTTSKTVPETQMTAANSEPEPMSLAAIIAANLTIKEKFLLGACGSYLVWFIVTRRHGSPASRLSRYRRMHREKNDRLPVRA